MSTRRQRLQFPRQPGVDPMFAMMDVTISLMFAMALLITPGESDTIEVPVAPKPDQPDSLVTASPDERPVVTVDEQGAVTINGQPTLDDELIDVVRRLTSASSTDAKASVRLRGHQHVEYGRLFAVRERLRDEFHVIEIGKVEQP